VQPAAWRRLQRLTPILSVPLLVGALWLLHRELAVHHPRDILQAIRALPLSAVVTALCLTAASYAVLPAYDAIGLRYVRHPVGVARTMLAGFLAYGFSQTLGFALVTGGSLRYRLYSAWGLSAAEIAQLIAVGGTAFWLGAASVTGVALAVSPQPLAGALGLSPLLAQGTGVVLLVVPAGYLAFGVLWHRPMTIRGWEFQPVGPRLALGQLLAGCIDWSLAAAVAYVLLLPTTTLSFPSFLGIFVLAQVIGLVSHVPGGLGVFETIVVMLLRGQAPSAMIVGSLLVYRIVYYFLPFAAAAVTLALYEFRSRRAAVTSVAHAAATWLPAVVPRALAAVTFAAGSILIFSGALPAESSRLEFLGDLVPLSVIEVSHFIGSVVGVGLLLLAWGLAHRLDAAFHVSVILLAVGMVVSVLKGIDYEEATVSGAALVALLAARRHFDRPASLLHEPFSVPWAAAVGVVLVVAAWLGLFAFRHVPYRGEMWWQFALESDAPRFLRATVGAFVAAGAFGFARLMRPAVVVPPLPSAEDVDAMAAIVATAPRTYANLVFLGDKSVLLDASRSAFLMYGVAGRSWIAMGDPVGTTPGVADLVWKFRELVDDNGGITVFYQVAPESLPLYLDLGLRPLKLGEEARVPLATFSLEGGSRKSLRRTQRQVEKDGGSFGLLAPADVSAAMGELRSISDAWLSEKNTREKSFSLGRFDPGYLSRFPAAIVRVEGRIVAFANLWTAGSKAELSIDLMRYLPSAPHGVMDYLFTELMLWGAREGYEWFNLGMAPLSGMEARSLAPLWNRVNALVYRHGEHFYNFQGLRQYKEKFDPAWTPKYLAAPGGLALPRVLTDLGALISGGLAGVLAK
jgi:phosphatidylglycerol lysyltransferase